MERSFMDLLRGAACFIAPPEETERGPEAGVRGASPGVWVRRTGGGMYAYIERGLSVYRGGSIPYSHFVCLLVCLFVCLSVRRILNCIFLNRRNLNLYRSYLNCIFI